MSKLFIVVHDYYIKELTGVFKIVEGLSELQINLVSISNFIDQINTESQYTKENVLIISHLPEMLINEKYTLPMYKTQVKLITEFAMLNYQRTLVCDYLSLNLETDKFIALVQSKFKLNINFVFPNKETIKKLIAFQYLLTLIIHEQDNDLHNLYEESVGTYSLGSKLCLESLNERLVYWARLSENEIKEMASLNVKLEAYNQNIVDELKTLKVDKQQLLMTTSDLESKVKINSIKIKSISEKLAISSENLNVLEMENVEQENNIKQLTLENYQLDAMNQSLVEDNSNLNSAKSTLEFDLEFNKLQVITLQNELEKANEKINQLVIDTVKQNNNTELLLSENILLNKENNNITKSNLTLKSDLELNKLQINTLQNEFDKANENTKQLVKQSVKQQSEIECLILDNSSQNEKNLQLNKQIIEIEIENEKYQNSVTLLKEELTELIDNSQKAIFINSELKSERDLTLLQIMQLQDELEFLNKKIAQEKLVISSVSKQVDSETLSLRLLAYLRN